jgi:hypothetical protein
VLAGKKFVPPLKGEAPIEHTDFATKREKDVVVTTVTVRNISQSPIARLTINETWYDKAGATVTAGRASINGLLQPGEIQTITIRTPWKAGMSGYQRGFTHANGTVKLHKVKQLVAPKPGAEAKTEAKK